MIHQDVDINAFSSGQYDHTDFEDLPDDVWTEIPILPQCPEPLHSLLCEMSRKRASDVHIDVMPNKLIEVRLRVDGIIHPLYQMEKEPGQRLINQIKIASKIPIGRNFMPTESQFRWTEEWGPKDIRIALTPVGNGESIHLRVMTVPDKIHNITQLGLSDKHHKQCREVMEAPSGLVLVSGATGAGKSSTLYSLASMLDLRNKVGMSIEDPIEYNLSWLRQIQVDQDHGLTMYEGLRTILRMDPDVILVGEIRDEQSAITATRAAMAGKLVIATVHARDAAAAVDSLHYLSVPNFIIGSTLRMVISQNLVRKLCMSCSTKRELTRHEVSLYKHFKVVPPDCVYEPVGCEDCSSYGHIGRSGVFEMVTINPSMSELITNNAGQAPLRASFRKAGYAPLIVDALEKTATGLTSMNEIRQACWQDLLNMEHELNDRPVKKSGATKTRKTTTKSKSTVTA